MLGSPALGKKKPKFVSSDELIPPRLPLFIFQPYSEEPLLLEQCWSQLYVHIPYTYMYFYAFLPSSAESGEREAAWGL